MVGGNSYQTPGVVLSWQCATIWMSGSMPCHLFETTQVEVCHVRMGVGGMHGHGIRPKCPWYAANTVATKRKRCKHLSQYEFFTPLCRCSPNTAAVAALPLIFVQNKGPSTNTLPANIFWQKIRPCFVAVSFWPWPNVVVF